jgi:SAM-dependent methyltransferase
MIFVGGGLREFLECGEGMVRYCIENEHCRLKPHERFIDVGCGIGRMARPLTKYLSAEGRYEGIDVVREGVDWCRKHYARYPNFHFQQADVYNKSYNPAGKYKASEYRFPFADESFDFVFLLSVFTHMLPKDVENYFSEVARVMKRGGRCLITYFLLNQEALAKMGEHETDYAKYLNFEHQGEGYRAADKATPELAIAFEEDWVLGLYAKHGLRISGPILYGSWCGRQSPVLQEIVLAHKG